MSQQERPNANKTKAVALSYDNNSDEAPKVIAKGEGTVAERIIEIAKANGIEIHQDKGLTEILSALDVDSVIPVEAYVAVAEILSYIYEKA
ncbi:MAG: EscU/YscU/HrcU family type III secretion system export apparatus switch protein [Alphaproteobacteria bacterium]|nr:EscU/YscU/HrcU family type III secretion system export apparatus switch protein [Alphaproteobacteria bacterium]OJV15792.1 MAG: hypothetical protein BGO27_07755 [Alphaproteobacteria bacterium 33-17]